MEEWDVYDVQRQKLGKTVMRGQELADGEYHLVVHACIFNANGELLIQQRSQTKSGWPGMWDLSVGGSALRGETAQEAIAREMREELGLLVDFSQNRPHLTIHFDQGFDDLFLLELDVALEDCVLQTEEVAAIRWASRSEIAYLQESGQFIPYYASLLDLLFDIVGQRGCEQKV